MTSRPDFNPSCPSGGTWYACGNGTRFTGCCGKYPCTDTGCPAGLLYPASFEGDKYGTFPDQECSAGLFYTCNFTTPRFLGCCQSGACANSNGCPSSDLAAAFLSKNPSIANAFDPQPPLPGAASATPSSTSTSASGAAAAASSSAATASEKPSTPVGAIAGGVAGGVALLGAIVFIIWRVRYNSKISSKQHRQRRHRTIPPFHHQDNAYTSNDYKGAMAGGGHLHAPYSDSPSIAPPYSGYHSPAPGFPSHKYSPQPPGLHEYVLEADGRPAFKPYSPELTAQHTPHNQSHLSPPTSHGHAYSTSWDSSTAVDTSHTTAPSQSQHGPSRFARVYQGPPQELSDNSEGRRIGLGVHHVITNHRPRAELDGGPIQE